MNYIKLDNDNISQIAAKSTEILNSGGIVIAPFDTVYGFIADPTNDTAIKKIFSLKKRPETKTIGLAVASIEQLESIAALNHRDFIESRIPGKYTFILSSRTETRDPEPIVLSSRTAVRDPGSISKYCSQNGTIGVRIPDNQLILEICRQFGPIAQTSANLGGQPNCFSIENIRAQFSEESLSSIDLIIDGGELEKGNSSEIWDLTKEEPVRIER